MYCEESIIVILSLPPFPPRHFSTTNMIEAKASMAERNMRELRMVITSMGLGASTRLRVGPESRSSIIQRSMSLVLKYSMQPDSIKAWKHERLVNFNEIENYRPQIYVWHKKESNNWGKVLNLKRLVVHICRILKKNMYRNALSRARKKCVIWWIFTKQEQNLLKTCD